MLGKSQEQNVAENSLAVQTDGSVTINQVNHTGLSADEVRAIAADSFKADFFKMLGFAEDVATSRAQKVVEDYLKRVATENPSALDQASDPDFRYALYTAQKAYARAGDENLEKLLVELLVQRSKEKKRNLIQIVLSESMEVISKLTDNQIAALTLLFLVRRTVNSGILSFNHFLVYADSNLQPYVAHASISSASYSHLAFAGCGVVQLTEAKLAAAFLHYYPGIFQAGVPADDAVVMELGQVARTLIIPSDYTPGNVQVLGGNMNHLNDLCSQLQIPLHDREKLNTIFQRGNISVDLFQKKCEEARPYLKELFSIWDGGSMKNFDPSSVGIAIAHANISQIIPYFGPLSIWID